MRKASCVLSAVAGLAMMLPATAEAASTGSIQKELDRVAAEYGKVETELAKTERKQQQLEKERQEADEIKRQKAEALRRRAGYMYKNGGFTSLMGQLLTSNSIGSFIRRMHFLAVLGSSDTELVDAVVVNQARADQIRSELAATEKRQQSLANRLASQREALEDRYAEVRRAEEARRRAAQEQLRSRRIANESRRKQLEATARGEPAPSRVSSAGRFSRFTLPVSPSGFANTWGAPRSGGRRHQGTDVMAPCGARVVAVTDGQITRLMRHGNGGTMAYLRANNGDVFLYSHLQGYAPGIAPGKTVSAGEAIGSNGNTGNARGGPCHVHFEWHPGGGRPVNPYPLLASAR
jgi:septal ring factor EnvC (AmiA/AmiB activator)